MTQVTRFSIENWVWKQICAGEIADLHQHLSSTLDPRSPEGWDERRQLSASFYAVLAPAHYASTSHPRACGSSARCSGTSWCYLLNDCTKRCGSIVADSSKQSICRIK